MAALRDKREKAQELRTMITGSLRAPRDEAVDSEHTRYVLEKRKNELEHMIEKGDDVSAATKEKLVIENRLLLLRDFYKFAFQRISEGMRREHRATNLLHSQLLDRSYMRRERLSRGDAGRS